jgi:hypothetical protein
MSRWDEEFENHGIHQTLLEVRECLDVEVKEPSSSLAHERRRLLKILDMIDDALAALDKETAPLILLTDINDHLHRDFWNQIQAYKSSPDASHLTNANAQIDGIMNRIFQLSGFQKNPKAIKISKFVEQSFDVFSKTIDSKSEEFSAEIKALESELQTTTGKHEALKNDFDNLATDHADKVNMWQDEFTANQKERAQGYSEAQNAKNKEFEEWFDAFQKYSESNAKKTIDVNSKALEEFFQKFRDDTDGMRSDAKKTPHRNP